MIKLHDRIILKTLDGKIIVRPQVDLHSQILTLNDNIVLLNESGVKAWNTGRELYPYHVAVACPALLIKETIL